MRRIQSINENWLFIKDDIDLQKVNIKEVEKEQVNIPHTWNNLDGQDGGDDYYRGTCYYMKKFKRPDMSEGDQVYLEFQGVNASAKIIVNDKEVCRHDGGYSTFRTNITRELQDNNSLLVMVDNSKNETVYPQLADFTFYGGIYRDVSLIIVSKDHFDLDHYGGQGIKVTPEVKGKDANVRVETFVTGHYDKVRVTIEGQDIQYQISKSDTEVEIVIPNVRLWNGTKDPYLYTAKADLIIDDKVVDTISTRFGCRTFSVDPEKGFILNGELYPLRGVSRHQDREGVGNALTKDMHKEDMELIAEMGANTIRLAHYQHDQYFYDLCDEYGMVVWAEIPYITKHMNGGRDNTISQMTELVIQNYNHPSICFWGVSNEITGGGESEELVKNNQELHELCKKLDPTRLTTMAAIFLLDMESPILNMTDIVAYNLYYGWYLGELKDNEDFLDEFHEKFPDRPIGLSEYGCEAVLKWQTSNPERGDYTEQYQAIFHEHMCKIIDERPYLWATHVWNMFDFGADNRDEGGVKGRNNKGLVTFDRKIKKDSYYIYKAYLSDQPFVHICGRRYVDRAEEVSEVKVYSNQKKVALYNNGTFIAEQEGDKIFTFKVRLDKENTIEAKSESVSKDRLPSKEVKDSIFIRQVDEPNKDYILPVENVSNWYEDIDLQYPEGYFSIKDTVGDLIETKEGLSLFNQMIEASSAQEQEGLAANVEITPEMQMRLMKNVTILTLVKNAKLPGEAVVALNKSLNEIKKP